MSFRLSSVKYDSIKDMINKFKGNENLELETRFWGKNFGKGKLDYNKYVSALNYFTESKENGGLGLKTKVRSELQVFDDYDTNKRLVIEGQSNIKKYWLGESLDKIEHLFMGKSRVSQVDVNEYSIRFSLSEEKDLDKGNEAINYIKNTNGSSAKLYRLKNRYEVFSENGIVRVDFTSVKESSKTSGSFKNSDTLKSNIKYEIEVELLHDEKIKKMSVEDIFKEFMMMNYLILSIIQKNRKILNVSKTNSIIQNYIKLVETKRTNNMNKFNKGKSKGFSFITASPITLQVENIEKNSNVQTIYNSYSVTMKADGERRLLYVDNDDKVYLIDINQNITNLDFDMKGWAGSLVECEYVEDIGTVLMYDMLFTKGRDIRRTHLKVPPSKRSKNNLGRLDNLEYFKNDLKKVGNKGIKIDIKKYLFSTNNDGSDIFDKAKELWSERDNLLYHVDGLIFVPIKEHYPLQGKAWSSLFKWKPPELNTVDFLVRTVKDKNGVEIRNPFLIEEKTIQGDYERTFQQYKTLELYVGGNIKQNNGRTTYGPKQFEPYDDDERNDIYNKTNVFIDSKNNMMTKDILSGKTDILDDDTIVEFGYDPKREEGFRWIPYRVRYDKTEAYKNGGRQYGNNENTANDVFRAIMIPVTEDIITTGKIPIELKKKAEEYVSKNVNKNNGNENSYYKYVNSNYQPGSRATYQNFHTLWVKESLFKSVAPSIVEGVNKLQGRLIDFASGKGGDINRYKRSKYAYVLGLEQDIKNIERAKEIYSKVGHPKPKAYFVRGDLRKLIFPNYDAGLTENNRINLEKFLPTKYTFNVASVMFAFHYFFESEITLRSFLQNVTDNLEVGGHFIGTTFDGKKLFDKLKGRKKISGSLDGELLWSIEKKYTSRTFPNTKTSLGRQVDVFVKSIGHVIPEYMVNFDYVDKLMEEYGLKKVEVKSFSEYFDDMEKNGNNSMKNIAKNMSDAEKEFSFLSSAFIYRKERNAADSVYSKLVKMMTKEETKKEANKEVKETMDKLGVEEVSEETEELIEGEEIDEDLNTDAESDLDINMDDENE